MFRRFISWGTDQGLKVLRLSVFELWATPFFRTRDCGRILENIHLVQIKIGNNRYPKTSEVSTRKSSQWAVLKHHTTFPGGEMPFWATFVPPGGQMKNPVIDLPIRY